jgi:hypothetical protein
VTMMSEREILRGMVKLRRQTTQAIFVEMFLAVMGTEDDGVRVRVRMTWPRPAKVAKR